MRKKSRNFAAAWALLAAVGVVHAADDNPYTKAKAGDWATYSDIETIPMKGKSTTVTRNVWFGITKKTDSEVTRGYLNTSGAVPSNATPPRNSTSEVISLAAPFVQGKIFGASIGYEITKELGTGNETLAVSGKRFDTKWIEFEWKDKTASGKIKMWICKDLPLEGVVRQVTEYVPDLNPASKTTMTMELKTFGFGK
jgi:hypothetical protein